MLEVLDGEQNLPGPFRGAPFDLSDVLFVTTANTTSTIPRPLLDRMEVIELSSYTDEGESLEIAKQHLLPKQLKRHGLKKSQVKLTDDAIRELIVSYTRESGVRVLERGTGRPVPEGGYGDRLGGVQAGPCDGETTWSSSWVPGSSTRKRTAWKTRWAWSTAWPGPP